MNPNLPDDSDDTDQTTTGPSFADKLKSVLTAMGQAGSNLMSSPVGQAASVATDPLGSLLHAATGAPGQQVMNTELPKVASAMNSMTGSNAVPPTPPPAPMPAPVQAAPQVAPASQPVQQQPVTPKAPTTPPAADLLNRITGNDAGVMQGLQEQLKNQDKKAKFAQALAIIGDTLGNMGQARAGQTPEGFTGLKAIQGINDTNRQHLLDTLPAKLAGDPNSQTSRLAQSQLAMAMKIGPNDPRYAAIAKMPAGAILQQMPQLTEVIKAGLEREKNSIMANQGAQANKLKEEEIKVSEANSKREQQTANQNAATSTLKDLSPLNPFNSDILSRAKQTLKNSLGGGQGGQSFTHPNGSIITKVN